MPDPWFVGCTVRAGMDAHVERRSVHNIHCRRGQVRLAGDAHGARCPPAATDRVLEKRVDGVHGAAWLAPSQHQISTGGLDHDVICSQRVPLHVGRQGSSFMRIAHDNPRHALVDFRLRHNLEFRPGDGVQILLQVARCRHLPKACQIPLAVSEMIHRADANAGNRYGAGNRPLLASLVWLAGPMVAPVPADGGWPQFHFQVQNPARLAGHRYAIRIGPFGRELERSGATPCDVDSMSPSLSILRMNTSVSPRLVAGVGWPGEHILQRQRRVLGDRVRSGQLLVGDRLKLRRTGGAGPGRKAHLLTVVGSNERTFHVRPALGLNGLTNRSFEGFTKEVFLLPGGNGQVSECCGRFGHPVVGHDDGPGLARMGQFDLCVRGRMDRGHQHQQPAAKTNVRASLGPGHRTLPRKGTREFR